MINYFRCQASVDLLLLAPLRLVHVTCVEAKGLIVAHQVIVVMRNHEQVWVYKQPHVVDIEGSEHFADGWDLDLALVKNVLFFQEEDTVGDGSVGVFVRVVIQADHVALGYEVEEHRCEECKETNDSTESSLHGEALDSYPCL